MKTNKYSSVYNPTIKVFFITLMLSLLLPACSSVPVAKQEKRTATPIVAAKPVVKPKAATVVVPKKVVYQTGPSESLNKATFNDLPNAHPQGLPQNLSNTVLFGVGSAKLNATSNYAIDVLTPFAGKVKNNIMIAGHTDATGSKMINQNLSINRAKSVKQALVNRQIAPNRMIVEGYASSRLLVYPELTREDRRLNRRAEILLPDNKTDVIQRAGLNSYISNMIETLPNQ